MDVTILGSGSPLPDAERAGPSGLISANGQHFLVDCGRGVLMRLAGAGLGIVNLNAVLLTHLHSDHTTDFNDVITSWWVMPFTAGRELTVIGPPGTKAFVQRTIDWMSADIGYRIDHHEDLTQPPAPNVIEVESGQAIESNGVTINAMLVDHGVVRPAIGFRFEADGQSAVWSGDTLPCDNLDELCNNADVYVQTVIREDLVRTIPVQRFLDIIDYHSTVEQAAQTAKRSGVKTLVLNHMVPAPLPGTEDEWIALAKAHFNGTIVLAKDLTKLYCG